MYARVIASGACTSGGGGRSSPGGSRLSASTLRYWAWKLGREQEGFVRVRTAPPAPEAPTRDALVLEVGGLRVVVSRDFDREALGQLLDVLRGRA